MKEVVIEVPDEVDVEKDLDRLTVSGPNGTVERTYSYPGVDVEVEDGDVVVSTEKDRRKPLATVGSFESEIENDIKGVTEGFEYKMKVLYSHFPMQVEVKGDVVEIRNFLGEKHPREAEILGETQVEVQDEEITLTGPDKEAVGQTAANIEQQTRINDKDIRAFQDGVYITEKAGKEVV
ncbi:MAG: 50S ribosomal protein L6 [Halobacteria archaeon]|nr:50S ribosomal protein L6 [Halobacteria archaeon]